MKHLRSFERVAYKHGGNRAVGPGHAATAEYVIKKLIKHTACEPYTQNFLVPVWAENESPTVEISGPWNGTLQNGIDGMSAKVRECMESGRDMFRLGIIFPDWNAAVGG